LEDSKTPESNLISVRFRYPPPSGVFPEKSMRTTPQSDQSGPRLIFKKVESGTTIAVEQIPGGSARSLWRQAEA
jgi:hypothetical protein